MGLIGNLRGQQNYTQHKLTQIPSWYYATNHRIAYVQYTCMKIYYYDYVAFGSKLQILKDSIVSQFPKEVSTKKTKPKTKK